MDNIRSRIRQIMMSEFDCEEGELTDSLGLDEILMDTWDWANLRDALEECFHVEVPDRLLGVRVESPFDSGVSVGGAGEIHTIGDLVKYVEEKCRRWLA